MPSLRAPARLSPLRVFDESDFAFIAGIAREYNCRAIVPPQFRLFT